MLGILLHTAQRTCNRVYAVSYIVYFTICIYFLYTVIIIQNYDLIYSLFSIVWKIQVKLESRLQYTEFNLVFFLFLNTLSGVFFLIAIAYYFRNWFCADYLKVYF